jgi:ankyrin repeat protein
MDSVTLQSCTSHRESESLVSQDPTWASKTAVVANDLFHSALHMNIDVDTSSASSVDSHDMELPGDSGSLSFSSSIMYARGFVRQNDMRLSNLDIFPDNSSLCETTHLGGISIPDFATSMFPVISRMFPRAASSPHLVILGNNGAFNSALRNMSHPSTLQLVHQQSIDHQIIYMIFHRLINDSDAVRALEGPQTELDQIFKTGVIHCFSLGKRGLSSLINSTPSSFIPALLQNIFRAALVLGNEAILTYVLKMDQASLANQSFFLGGDEYYPLEYAGRKGHIQATKALLDHGADPNQRTDRHGRSFLAMILGSPWENRDPRVGVQVLRLLIDHGLEPQPREFVGRMKQCTKDELSVLATHSLNKSFETFFENKGLPVLLLQPEWDDPCCTILKSILNRAFLEIDGQRATWDQILRFSLSAAVLRSRTSAVEILLSMGATPDTHCLISAAQSNDMHMLKDLLGRGLDPNTIFSRPMDTYHDLFYMWDRDDGCTALSQSIMNHSRGAFQILQEQGFISRLPHQPAGFASAFVAACQVGDSALIEQLLKLPKFPRTQEKLGNAIEAAMRGDQFHIIDKLLSAGMKPSIRSLELALEKKQLTTVILLARQLDIFGRIYPYPSQQKNAILWEALRWGNHTAIEHVLKIGHPINVCDEMTDGKLADWKLLPEIPTPGLGKGWNYTPLAAAILGGNTITVRTLMDYGIQAVSFRVHGTSHEYNSYATTSDYRHGWILTPLAAAAATNDVPLCKGILRIGADPFDNSALLLCSVIGSREEFVALLISAFKARYPDGAQSFGSDALYKAIRGDNLRLLKLLAKDGDLTGPVEKDRGDEGPPYSRPDVVFTSPLGEAVLQHAERQGAGGALDYLLPLVKDLNAIVHRTYRHDSMTALLYAISLGSLATVRKLHQAGADISLPAKWLIPRTPLQAAAQAGSKDIVEYLLNQGINPNESPADRAGATALQLAAITGKIGVATVLLDAGAEINAPPAFGDGRTAFEGATEHGRIEMMIFLVSRGADLLSNGSVQYRRAVEFAEDNAQHAARKLADELYGKVSASQGLSFIDMGVDAWAGVSASSFESFL